jgi:hypothetical protein
MPTPYGIDAISPATADAKPHILGFSVARTAPDDMLLEVRNGPDAGDTVLSVDKDGDVLAGADQTLVVRQLAGRTAVQLGNWVIEYNAALDSLDFSYEP